MKSLKFSIRRKITANYLTLYLVVSAMTFILMVFGFMKAELSEKSYEIYTYVDTIVGKYEEGIYDLPKMEQRISSVAEIENCGIQLTFYNSNQIFKSDRYHAFQYPNNFWQKIGTLISYKMFPDELVIYYFDPEGGEQLTARLELIHPIAPFYKHLSTLSTMLFISIVLGFFILWIFGSVNNRRILRPIYDITKTAEKISINNMKERLDVGKAKYELRDLAITLNDMLSRLQEEYEKQKRFVSDVSHELRTPISIVNGYAGMLRRWGKEDESILEESIEAIIDEAKNMQVLVENLLTLVRADNQTLQFHKEDFYMNEIMKEVTSESQMINGKNQLIDCECVEPILVHLDYQMTKQVLRIFVDNAVKYTPPEGQIHIRCVYEEDQCAVYIKDTGIGISKEDLPYIFDRFYRSDESRTRETGGHGLGLSIAKAIVLGHGGRIKVKSKKNEGSEFAIFLPIKPT
ncbi:MAG: HAMP domain-containing histidine kinase [Vallitaleaceae bacterium]|nr:HAMP domain-containing histidine kinase [Vallitaleaceae bacterium]